jgi:hypothetical protein
MQIETNNQYVILITVIESYLRKGFDNLSEAEGIHLQEISNAVEKWEMQK